MLKFLFKKEINDILFSYKSLLFLTICSIFPSMTQLKGDFEKPIWVEILFIQMLAGQFMYDSYLLDVKHGGISFVINRKINFIYYFFCKNIIYICVSLIPILINIRIFVNEIPWINILWIILSISYCNSLMFIASIFSKGEEIITALFVTILYVLILIILWKVKIVYRFIIVVILDFIFAFISYRFSKTLLFRKQII